MSDQTSILLDIQKQVGHTSGEIVGMKEVADKIYRQTQKTNGRVTTLEAKVADLQKRPTYIEHADKVTVKGNSIMQLLSDKWILILGSLGLVIAGIIETLLK